MYDFKGLGTVLAVMAGGIAVLGGGAGFVANEVVFKPQQLQSDFNARANEKLSQLSLRPITLTRFAKDPACPAAANYSASFTAEDAQGKVARGRFCISARSEIRHYPAP